MNCWDNNSHESTLVGILIDCEEAKYPDEIFHASCYMTDKLIRTLGLLHSLPYLSKYTDRYFQCQIVLYEQVFF